MQWNNAMQWSLRCHATITCHSIINQCNGTIQVSWPIQCNSTYDVMVEYDGMVQYDVMVQYNTLIQYNSYLHNDIFSVPRWNVYLVWHPAVSLNSYTTVFESIDGSHELCTGVYWHCSCLQLLINALLLQELSGVRREGKTRFNHLIGNGDVGKVRCVSDCDACNAARSIISSILQWKLSKATGKFARV